MAAKTVLQFSSPPFERKDSKCASTHPTKLRALAWTTASESKGILPSRANVSTAGISSSAGQSVPAKAKCTTAASEALCAHHRRTKGGARDTTKLLDCLIRVARFADERYIVGRHRNENCVKTRKADVEPEKTFVGSVAPRATRLRCAMLMVCSRYGAG